MDAHDRLLGEIAVQLALVTREQLSRCLHAQKCEPRPRDLGEIMVELKLLTREQLSLCVTQRTKVLKRRRKARQRGDRDSVVEKRGARPDPRVDSKPPPKLPKAEPMNPGARGRVLGFDAAPTQSIPAGPARATGTMLGHAPDLGAPVPEQTEPEPFELEPFEPEPLEPGPFEPEPFEPEPFEPEQLEPTQTDLNRLSEPKAEVVSDALSSAWDPESPEALSLPPTDPEPSSGHSVRSRRAWKNASRPLIPSATMMGTGPDLMGSDQQGASDPPVTATDPTPLDEPSLGFTPLPDPPRELVTGFSPVPPPPPDPSVAADPSITKTPTVPPPQAARRGTMMGTGATDFQPGAGPEPFGQATAQGAGSQHSVVEDAQGAAIAAAERAEAAAERAVRAVSRAPSTASPLVRTSGLPPSDGMLLKAPLPRPSRTTPTGDGYLDRLLKLAVQHGASDLHVHSNAEVMARIHGQLRPMSSGQAMRPKAAEKVMAELMSDEQWEVLARSGQVDFSYEMPGTGRFRVNAYKQQSGLDIVFRIIPAAPPSLEDLGLPARLANLVDYRTGMVLCTGPAGCGKSSTLAALVNLVVHSRRDHILTVEDPVEFVYPRGVALVNQRQVNTHTKSYASALKAALREDPDIIVIAEMRDLETISLAMSAAETGHLVLGSLHTGNAAQTIGRICTVFPAEEQEQARVMLAESLRAVISQRLVPTTDGNGRVPALELLMVSTAVSNIIRDNKTYQLPSVMQTGKAAGMITLDDSLDALVKAGTITSEAARRCAVKKERFGGKG
ncbi:MAG: PilT/PilU family type 4a pilus ATPase [Myxococcales bacterium]|nr:PilT/PilU family type 4a pilus ATPase [Myxococcales bacterium]